MVQVRGRPLGLLGWLILVVLDRAVGEGTEDETGQRPGALVERDPEMPLMERRAA
jgi:hypothetical protein